MKAVHEPNHDSSDELLDRALQATLAQPAPHDVRQRVIETAAAWSHGTTPGHPQQRGRFALPVRLTTGHFATARTVRAVLSNFRGRGRLGLAAAAAFVATVAGILWLSHPNASWAQVAEALRTKPWSLGKYTTPDGEVHEDWLSFSRDVSAHRHGDSVQFSDHRLNVTYEYNAKERTLTRHLDPQADHKKRADRWFEKVFHQISRGAEQLDFAASDVELVEQTRGPATKHGRTWLSYELVIRVVDADVVDPKPIVRLTLLVDPQTRLPHYLVMSDPNMNPPSIEMEVSYPETGPIDIYDLGIPRDAELVDLVPTDDIRRVISEIKSSAERFEEHLALNVMSDALSPWYVGTPFAVWRKGTSYRMVYGVVDAASVSTRTPKSDADQRQWWKSRWTELFQVPHEICDGSTYWNNEGLPAGWSDQPNKPNPITWRRATWPQPKWKSRPERHPWPAGSSPLFIAYPQNLVNFSAFRWKPVLDLTPADGPANTVKVILRTGTTGSSSGEERYWIDAQRSHMVARYESVTWDATNSPPVEVVNLSQVVETADRSPQGIWYPTLIRHISVTEQTGVKKTIETITRHYLDFDVKFTDDLFKPAERPGEPLE
ncbi:MAG: hypothetical protein ACKV0T_12160 [Planctomycetales bacterium]